MSTTRLVASYCFDRDQDWRALVSYVENQQAEPTLGVVSGRRKQGKTYLLTALAQATGGFYFGADEATETEALRLFGMALAEFSRSPVQFGNWDDALPYLFSLADDRPLPLIIDEIPHLIRASPQLPSPLQRPLDSRWYLLAEAVAARTFPRKRLPGQAAGPAGLDRYLTYLRIWPPTPGTSDAYLPYFQIAPMTPSELLGTRTCPSAHIDVVPGIQESPSSSCSVVPLVAGTACLVQRPLLLRW